MPIYDTSSPLEKEKAKSKFEYLINKGKVLELKEKKATRSLSQNNYLHLIFSWYSIETGMPPEYVKQTIFKQIVNPNTFRSEAVNKITGECVEVWRSTADLDTKEMTTCIDRFRDHSSQELGIYLPAPDDMVLLRQMEQELENQKQYL